MGRQVVKMAADRGALRGAGAAEGQGDAFLERLLKLIPAETIAVYLFLQGILQSALANQEAQLQVWLWVVSAVLLVGNILYVRRFHNVTDLLQYVILSLAFVVWVVTLGGPFQFLDFWQPFMGSVILGLFTFFVPVFYAGVDVSG